MYTEKITLHNVTETHKYVCILNLLSVFCHPDVEIKPLSDSIYEEE